jgi:hypothetical protein
MIVVVSSRSENKPEKILNREDTCCQTSLPVLLRSIYMIRHLCKGEMYFGILARGTQSIVRITLGALLKVSYSGKLFVALR